MSNTPMYKTTVVIWSDFDPREAEVELSDLAREAEEGGAYASSQVTVAVERSLLALDPDATEGMQAFFEISDEADEDDYDLDQQDPADLDGDASSATASAANSRVMARMATDDGLDDITFDATAWFETADVHEIIALVECGFGGDYPADAVADHFEGTDPSITQVYQRVQSDNLGFEVYVNAGQAIAWIAAHRSDEKALMAALADVEEA